MSKLTAYKVARRNLQDSQVGTKPISRQAAFSMASARFKKAVEVIDDCLASTNRNVRFPAAKLVWETVLPQKALLELTGENGGAIKHELSDEQLSALINDKLKQLGISRTVDTNGGNGEASTSPSPEVS